MAKLIRITPEKAREFEGEFEKCKKAFLDLIGKAQTSDGKFTFSKSFTAGIKRRAKVFFTEQAWAKMVWLIDHFDSEVAWHGLAKRCEDESKDEYVIYDIIVYPQSVDGTNVNTDQVKYEKWIMEQEDDVFNNIRMQGHSHVKMQTNPSSVDLTHQEKIVEQLDGSMFYIFMIWNKYGSRNTRIFDMKKNVLFENADVDVEVLDGDMNFKEFMKTSNSMVVAKPTYGTYNGSSYKSYGSSYNSSAGTGSYGSGYYDQKGAGKGSTAKNSGNGGKAGSAKDSAKRQRVDDLSEFRNVDASGALSLLTPPDELDPEDYVKDPFYACDGSGPWQSWQH